MHLLAHISETPLASDERELTIHGLHAHTGELRTMQQHEAPGTAALAVLEKLRMLQVARVGDVFHMAAVSSKTIRAWMDEHAAQHGSAAIDYTDLNCLLDANILQKTSIGGYTFGCFDLHRKLRQQRPRVCGLLAWGDRAHASVTALQTEIARRGVADSVLCTDAAAGDAMSMDGLAPWMSDIATPRTDQYVNRLVHRAHLHARLGSADGTGCGSYLDARRSTCAWCLQAHRCSQPRWHGQTG